jgi:NADH-quinone oxidoreductase subunit H
MSGLIHSLADAVKLIFKEDFISKHIRAKGLFIVAPAILFVMAMLTLAVIPFADSIEIDGKSFRFQAIPVDFGILWYLGFAALSVYGVILAGFSSSNKFSLLGAIRASAQSISYEIAMGLAVVSMVISYDSVDLNQMVIAQSSSLFGVLPSWGFLLQPLACVIFITTAFAETNRTPFDLAEGESELVSGYHTEYSAMRFALFFMAEYVAMIVASGLIVTMFFGGYNLPFISTEDLRGSSSMILLIIAVALPFIAFRFIKWIEKNNVTRYETKNEFRVRENSIFKKMIIGIVAIIEVVAILTLANGVDSFDAQIITVILQILIFSIKLIMMLFVFVWVRWTLPRFRYDQLQKLGWSRLLPLGFINVILSAIIVTL